MSTREEIASHLDLSVRAVMDLLRRGVLPRAERQQLSLEACRVSYIRHLREKAAGRGGTTLVEERAALDATKREMLELQIAEKRGDLVDADEYDRALVELSTATSARIQSIPTALALELATESDPSRCKSVLKAALDDALGDLAEAGRKAAARASRAVRAGAGARGDGAAAESERARVGRSSARGATRDDAGTGALAQ
jgi:phage terminase Nu1 subunit (DNA packaging protein)